MPMCERLCSRPLPTLLWVGLLALTGCAEVSPNASEPYPAQRALVGATGDALLACAGSPVIQRTTGEEVLFIYYREASQFEESFGGSKSSFPMVHHGCRATIRLEQDRVTDVRYESEPSSYQDEDHCEEMFQSCVNP
jgi:hypothetical protein